MRSYYIESIHLQLLASLVFMKSCERNEMKKSLGNSQICQHHIQHKILDNLVTFHLFLKISRRDFSLVALSVSTGSEVSWKRLWSSSTYKFSILWHSFWYILVELFSCSSDFVIIYNYAELELTDVIGNVRFSRLWQQLWVHLMRVTALGWEQNFSIFYVRDKEAYFASWNVFKVFFQQSQERGKREKSDRGWSFL